MNNLSLQPKIQRDLMVQERSVAVWAEAMLQLERMCDSIFLMILREILEVLK